MKTFLKIFLLLILTFPGVSSYSQFRIRLLADKKPETIIFSVVSGKYDLDTYDGNPVKLVNGDLVILVRFNNKIAVKIRNSKGFAVDSLSFNPLDTTCSFSIKAPDSGIVQNYTGTLECKADLGTILMLNICDEDEYISGVVLAEGGTGKNTDFYKTQAILVRTYLYKYSGKHADDGYNLCDNTHCQAFNGKCNNADIRKAVEDTKGMVIIDRDSNLIISAFHSNCGGETASSNDVWLTSAPYLVSVKDPYCKTRNSEWQKTIDLDKWAAFMKVHGFNGKADDPKEFGFLQDKRMTDYRIGSVKIPFTDLRNAFELRSAFFSVYPGNNSVILKGRGYGHGVGLCQEGAILMAAKGFTYRKIIDFYFHDVLITDVRHAKNNQF
jgi:stage II sporulation protein D